MLAEALMMLLPLLLPYMPRLFGALLPLSLIRFSPR